MVTQLQHLAVQAVGPRPKSTGELLVGSFEPVLGVPQGMVHILQLGVTAAKFLGPTRARGVGSKKTKHATGSVVMQTFQSIYS